MKEHLTTEKEKELIEVKPSKREILFNNKVVYAITIMTK